MLEYEPVAIVLLLITLLYIGAPLQVRFSQKHAAHPDFEPLELDELDPSIAEFLMARTTDLFDVGFEEPTLVYIPRPTSEIATYLIMLVNRVRGDKAMVTAMVVPRLRRKVLYLEFSTRFEDSQEFNTHNVPELLYPAGPGEIRTQVPQVQDIGQLYALHNYVMDINGASGKKVLYEPNKALEYLARNVFVDSFENRVKRGLMYYDQRTDSYRPTLKGAFLMTWALMPPIKGLRKIALTRRATKIVQEFDKSSK